ncbi:MAG TPA: tetratricopeptide repeat protein [Desulfosalsimonadaceae bacterium]|nr:tetratricopeptide repeat protein [Desulfosalsimonadaceae bacterium]
MAEDSENKLHLPEQDQLEAYAKRLLEFVKAKQKILIAAAAAVVLVAAAVAGVVYFQKKAEEKAQTLLGSALAQIQTAARNQASDEQYGRIQARLQKIVEQYGSTSAGKASMLKYADLSYQQGDYETAITMYQRALEAYKDDPGFYTLVMNGLAYCYEAKENYAKAASCFRRIVEKQSAVMKDQALFNLGRMYAKTGETEKRRQVYERLASEHPDSMYARLAEKMPSG